jgi:hypothetical protein
MRIRQLLLAVAYRRIHGAADIQNPDPLIKSQIQSGPEPDIDFFFDNRRCMFRPGSGTERAQRRRKALRMGPRLAGGLC